MIKLISKLANKEDLSREEAKGAMNSIMEGKATDAQIGSFLTALSMKGETTEELIGFTEIIREKSLKVSAKDVVDLCGTGGDNASTFNISTTAAFIAAGAGVRIAKHGNRAFSSSSGSADVMEALGIDVNMAPELIEKCINRTGMGFCYAPQFHLAARFAMKARKEIGIRTVFNILGPMANPANPEMQLIGAFSPELTAKMAFVLGELGCKKALIVHGYPLDELSTTGITKISELNYGRIRDYTIEPEQFGIKRVEISELKGGTTEENAITTINILKGEKGAKRDISVMNAGAAIMLSGKANSLQTAIMLAEKSIDSGAALDKLKELREFGNASK